ncbi:MAG: hypothetical protein AAGF07_03195 [Patescibacteria group bacterium]
MMFMLKLNNFNQDQNQFKITKFLKLSLVFLAIMVINLVLVYQLVYLPNQVANNLNSNVQTYNQIVENLNTIPVKTEVRLSGESTSSGKLAEQITTAKEVQSANQEFLEQAQEATKLLDNGPTTENQELTSLIQQSLNKKIEITEYNSLVKKNQICIAEELLKFVTNLEKVVENLRSVSSLRDETKVIENLNDSADRLEKGAIALKTIKNCFDADLINYYTQDVENDVDADVELYETFTNLLKQLAEAVSNQDDSQIEAKTTEILNLNTQKSRIIENNSLQNVIESILEEAILKNQEVTIYQDKINNRAEQIKQKYNISEV